MLFRSRREFVILREEVTAAVRRKVRRESAEEEAMTGVTVILDTAERNSLAGYQAAGSRRASDR